MGFLKKKIRLCCFPVRLHVVHKDDSFFFLVCFCSVLTLISVPEHCVVCLDAVSGPVCRKPHNVESWTKSNDLGLFKIFVIPDLKALCWLCVSTVAPGGFIHTSSALFPSLSISIFSGSHATAYVQKC